MSTCFKEAVAQKLTKSQIINRESYALIILLKEANRFLIMLDESVNKMGTPLKRFVELRKAEKSAEMIKIKGAAHHEAFRCTCRR